MNKFEIIVSQQRMRCKTPGSPDIFFLYLFEALAVRLALRFESRPKDILVSAALRLAKPVWWEIVSLMNTSEI